MVQRTLTCSLTDGHIPLFHYSSPQNVIIPLFPKNQGHYSTAKISVILIPLFLFSTRGISQGAVPVWVLTAPGLYLDALGWTHFKQRDGNPSSTRWRFNAMNEMLRKHDETADSYAALGPTVHSSKIVMLRCFFISRCYSFFIITGKMFLSCRSCAGWWLRLCFMRAAIESQQRSAGSAVWPWEEQPGNSDILGWLGAWRLSLGSLD